MAAMPTKTPKLSGRMLSFVLAYLADPSLNGSSAARAAGYRHPDRAAHKLLNKPLVKQAIAAEMAERAERERIRGDRVLRELGWVGFLDPRELLDERGAFLPLENLPEHVARAVASLRVSYTEEVQNS